MSQPQSTPAPTSTAFELIRPRWMTAIAVFYYVEAAGAAIATAFTIVGAVIGQLDRGLALGAGLGFLLFACAALSLLAGRAFGISFTYCLAFGCAYFPAWLMWRALRSPAETTYVQQAGVCPSCHERDMVRWVGLLRRAFVCRVCGTTVKVAPPPAE